MNLPSILVNKSQDEASDITMISDVLEPSQSSQTTARFVIPYKASVLDNLSSLVFRCEWKSYDESAKTTEGVVFKDACGSLPAVKRARMYIGQKLIMNQEHCGTKMYIDKRFEEADAMTEVYDARFGSQNDYFLRNDSDFSNQEFSVGQFELGRDCPAKATNFSTTNKRFTRKLGSGADGWETQLFLDELFTGLKDLSIPMMLKEQLSIEVDWETSFDKLMYDISPTGSRIPANRKNVEITNVRLLTDYIGYDQATHSALESQVLGQGIILPFRDTIVIERTLNATTSTSPVQEDIPLSLNSKAVMKVVVQKLVNCGSTRALGVGKTEFCGDCRSDALPDESYNLLVNDLLIYDQPVDTRTQMYNQLSQVGEKPFYAYPDSLEFRDPSVAVSTNDVLSNSKTVSGFTYNKSTINTADAEVGSSVSSGQAGSLSFLGISLGKYGRDSNDTLADAGYRIGSSPVQLRYSRSGGATSKFEGKPVKVNLFVDVLKVLDLNAGFSDVRDQ